MFAQGRQDPATCRFLRYERSNFGIVCVIRVIDLFILDLSGKTRGFGLSFDNNIIRYLFVFNVLAFVMLNVDKNSPIQAVIGFVGTRVQMIEHRLALASAYL